LDSTTPSPSHETRPDATVTTTTTATSPIVEVHHPAGLRHCSALPWLHAEYDDLDRLVETDTVSMRPRGHIETHISKGRRLLWKAVPAEGSEYHVYAS